MQSPDVVNPLDLATSPTLFYTWQNYRCAYTVHHQSDSTPETIPLLLIHPIGVGLSRQFWQRFCHEWSHQNHRHLIYNPDLLGCGESDMPPVAYTPSYWAEQLHYFLQTVVQRPVIVVVQGALFPVAIKLVQKAPQLIHALVLSGPPGWPIITKQKPIWQQKLAWSFFNSPFGKAFFRYARTPQFLRSFSTRRLFASADAVDAEWLDTLMAGANDLDSRHAVFAFLAGFWRQDYSGDIAAINQPTLVVVGEQASSISREGKQEKPDERLADYLAALPQGRGMKLAGRNVLPYETTADFVSAIAPFISEVT
jgi:pimeloyl-ACP methyl ester carboxylesterase